MSTSAATFEDDLALADACLAGQPKACEEFEDRYGARMVKVLSARGASPTEANDLARNLLSDCIVAPGNGSALLSRYEGKCSLQTWLATCGTRRFIDLKRHEAKKVDLPRSPDSEAEDPFHAIVAPVTSQLEAHLTVLLRDSLEAALVACPAESRLMLQLIYIEGLTQREVGRMWNYHESKVSRQLKEAMGTIQAITLAKVKEFDPFLRITWDDFVEMCESSLTGLPW